MRKGMSRFGLKESPEPVHSRHPQPALLSKNLEEREIEERQARERQDRQERPERPERGGGGGWALVGWGRRGGVYPCRQIRGPLC